MNDGSHRTDTLNSGKFVQGGKQQEHWVEFQLLDELGQPLPNLPYRAVNDATRHQVVPEYRGQTDSDGIIRIEGLHPIPLTLLIEADPLAEVLQTRRLRAIRAEPQRPGIGDLTPLHCPQCSGHSPWEKEALAQGHAYHYLRIGQLCDRLPTLDPPIASTDPWPEYHFPDREFRGFTLGSELRPGQVYRGLRRRHVLEICPFRAWSLVLNHQPEYCLVTAYNLGLMSTLSYMQREAVKKFFLNQCLDLSRTPRIIEERTAPPCVVTDVPFNKRYSIAELLDTTVHDTPEGDTQLFYASSPSQVLVAWRGTEIGLADLSTDVTFRPVAPEVQANCEPTVPCADLTSAGSVHLGFRDAYEVARRLYATHFQIILDQSERGKKLFICGHSLGGALGLIHAAALKESSPQLYTYGMPRTFTLQAVDCLKELRHFRHVNDTDLIPDVPPEADLDNSLYDLYGPLGSTLGTAWALGQLVVNMASKGRDPFYHQGAPVTFYRARQHIRIRASENPFHKSREGLGAPYHTTISRTLPVKAKLFVAPCLNEADNEQARAAQQRFNASLTPEAWARYFPQGGKLKRGTLPGVLNHFMSEYQPYLYCQLIESINPKRMQERQEVRQQFKEQMGNHGDLIPEDELIRNRIFLELQGLVSQTLEHTRRIDGGNEALERFDAVAEEKLYVEKILG